MLSALDGAVRDSVRSRIRNRRSIGDVAKVLIDFIASFFALVFLAPAIGVICVLLLLQDGRPLIYRHKRIGRDGRVFDCFKFRTMRRDADKVLQELLQADEAANREWKAYRKLRRDPRIHPLGQFLRVTSLDEIPQFLNVLRGEMSIVGPRPVVEEELALYGDRAHCYLSLTPGITGLWQVSGRNDTSYDDRVELDARYHATRSFSLDVWIMWRTVGVLLLQRNGR
ncbi:sugar transferase [Chelativorans sp. AA-79]|uniref:sugar transferase n=1 Tax=Chelativorans sp. AA-79 TaxID=3028735 RepID=UPI0023F96254|nr:sugar transferase [Chelativorans sp. AA-79]WEX10478.1 sugar transferase [Chelativorans sp. AA-79]